MSLIKIPKTQNKSNFVTSNILLPTGDAYKKKTVLQVNLLYYCLQKIIESK